MDIVVTAITALAAGTLTAALFLRGGLVAGCLAVLFAGACFGHPLMHVSLGPLPLTMDRVLLALLLVQCLVYRRLGRIEPRPAQVVDWILAAFLIVLAVSAFTHDWQIDGYQPAAKLLFFFVMPAAMYWVARQTPSSHRSALWVFGSLALFGIYLALTAVAEVRGAWGVVFPRYIVSAAHTEFLGRARGPFLNPVANGIVICTCLCALLMWWPRLGRGGQAVLVGVAGLLLCGAYATLTRSVWIGAAGSLLLFLALSLPRQVRYACVGAVALVSVEAVAANWERFLAFKRDREISAAEVAESAKLRPILAVVAKNMFYDRPLLGCGLGQYDRAMVHYLADRSTGLPLEKARGYVQHNAFLSLLTEVGLIGVALFTLLLLLWGHDAWRRWNDERAPLWARQMGLLLMAMLASYLPNAMFHDTTLMPSVTMLLCLLAGMVQSARVSGFRAPQPDVAVPTS
jgi:hypothetical protein